MSGTNLKRTALYDWHKNNGGKIVDFAGWELPVQYTGVIPEHKAVREAAGLFDVSHMGEVFVTGPEAEAALEYLTCNEVSSLSDGKAQYSALLNEKGGVVDDIIVYRFSRTRYLVCVNASNASKDFDWMVRHNKHQAEIVNQSAEFGQIALQGPKAAQIISKLCDSKVTSLEYFHFCEAKILNVPVIAARTGYTGEDGFEFFVPWDSTEKIWCAILEAGKPDGLIACGLGARDSLRLEACYPLHGHELGDEISALASGLSWVVRFNKGDFVGASALTNEKKQGTKRALVGFFVDDPGIARHGDRVLDQNGKEIGIVTSGTKTPTLNRALGLALVDKDFAKNDTTIFTEVRGKSLRSHVVKKPFYTNVKK